MQAPKRLACSYADQLEIDNFIAWAMYRVGDIKSFIAIFRRNPIRSIFTGERERFLPSSLNMLG